MSFMLDPDKPGYLYNQVAEHIEARIRAGELRPNEPLYAENKLANEYGVSLGTSRHAVRILCERGLLRVVPSKGVYVVPLDQVPDADEVASGVASCSCARS
ncbi:winged helix-turn-helix domain-containing protein [Amycolatopsis pithecellobii]|uniref:GntR family transcriptional regulator n=1 Tax=Amycolatopsis pithecellobii TaxID=664692 RepID=A0A6N7Z5G4_9PSEU|nr:winged helix-turn-helix domain-containing protein [Amycolatopsis pithecellobii]MTD56869.1 GntR family transcriptional regulator [Amycolatopsis pithecellobii]